jgi:uncharacterized GH25 family protein
MSGKRELMSLFCALVLLSAGSEAFAHNLWLNPSNHFPQPGETVDIGIGWGHRFTASRTHEEVKETTVEEITALDPDGQTVKLERESAALYKIKVEKAGVYLVAARIKPGVFTMTPEGRKWATRKEVENPVKCTAFHISAKTVLVVGGSDRNLSALTNQPLELAPLSDPSRLKNGSALPVKVLFEGKPLAGFPVKATFAGYEEPQPVPPAAQKPAEKSEGAKAAKEAESAEANPDQAHRRGGMRLPVETVTDDQGQAVVPVDRPGHWMISLSHKPPYPDAETCDEYMYNDTFTFQVK